MQGLTKEQQNQKVPLESLHPQQLLGLKKQFEDEIQQLAQSYQQFKIAGAKYEDSKQYLNILGAKESEEAEILIPITGSLYVEGIVADNQNVMIDYGTGYYVERSIDQAKGFCDRKTKMLNDNANKVETFVNQKRQFIEQIQIEVTKKYQQAMDAQSQQKKE